MPCAILSAGAFYGGITGRKLLLSTKLLFTELTGDDDFNCSMSPWLSFAGALSHFDLPI